jgi:superfamily I DNA/RNA helicase
LIPTYDMVVVDEAQDMSRAQLLIAKGVADLARAARIVVVGDDRQSLYGFRGAASDALDNLKAELHADELGLNTTYRCPRLVVERASRIVPDYEAHATAQDGEVRWLPNVQAMAAETAPGDFVLSRKNAPLAQVAMAHIRANKRVRVAGKDLGAGLVSLAGKIAEGRGGSSYVTCSSVHKAKGLEAERVYVLVETLYPSMPCASCGHFHKPLRPLSQTPRFSQFEVRYAGDHTCWRCGCPEQRQPEGRMREEANIEYVALTRAKKTLVLVGGQCPVDLEPPAPVVKAEAEVTS